MDYVTIEEEGVLSFRETAMRVAAGAIAKKYLREQLGIEVAEDFYCKLEPLK